MMTSLLPVAASSLSGLVQSVGQILRGDAPFQRLLRAESEPVDAAPQAVSGPAAPSSPESSSLALHVQLETLRRGFEARRTETHQALMSRFATAGIDLTEPAVLSVTNHGRLCEMSGHWDRARIEELLASDDAMCRQLQQLLYEGQQLHSWGSARDPDAQAAHLVITSQDILLQTR